MTRNKYIVQIRDFDARRRYGYSIGVMPMSDNRGWTNKGAHETREKAEEAARRLKQSRPTAQVRVKKSIY